MRAKSLTLTILLTSVVLWHATPATAQSKEALLEFDRLVSQGRDAYDAGDFARAIDAFKGAEVIYAHPKISARIVESHAQLGHCARAEARLSKLRVAPNPPEELDALADSVGQCRSSGSIEVICSPSGLALKLDEKRIACAESVKASAGEHRLVASAPGDSLICLSFLGR